MKNKFLSLLTISFIAATMLIGCAGNAATDTETDVTTTVSTDEDDKNNESEEILVIESNTENTEEREVKEETGIFAQLPEEFYFSSGAGGWGTELFLEDDGTFWGIHHDSDMGQTGEGYPNGTQYISRFNGKFTEPVQISEYVYSTSIEFIEIEREGEEYIEDRIKYIVCEPYGLDNADEILIYLYGIPFSELPEGFLSWIPGNEIVGDTLQSYGIYNVNEETAFTGKKYEDYRELSKLHGTYINELGDKLTIRLAGAIDSSSYELGFVDWFPHDGEQQYGTITKNGKGGFTINLEESQSYSFKMTNYELGNIEFIGDGKWSEQLGRFVMQ